MYCSEFLCMIRLVFLMHIHYMQNENYLSALITDSFVTILSTLYDFVIYRCTLEGPESVWSKRSEVIKNFLPENIYKIKFPVNNKIYFPVFTFFIYMLYNNIINHEIINIYDT